MPKLQNARPRTDGFWMPAEWEPHAQCWMLWPIRTDTWRNGAKPAQAAFVEVAKAISQFEPVTMCVPFEQYQNARSLLPPEIRVVEMSANDAWMRDVGPTFVINDNGGVRGVDWEFNAWGGIGDGAYFPWDEDAQVAQKVLGLERIARYKAPITTEGGALHVDGEGTLLATRTSIINPNRNPGLSATQMEAHLRDYLNIQKVIWLGEGVYKDETDGHIDNLCCFVKPGVVALTWTDDRDDPQYERSSAAYDILQKTTDAKGRRLEIHKIHQPGPLFMSEQEARGVDVVENAHARLAGNRLAASYINFYIANGGLVMPVFDDPHDENALRILGNLFPDRKVVGVPGREILLGGGNIHCITQQQPAPRNESV